MGHLRDTEQMVPGDSVQATLTENATLKRRVQQLTQEHRALQERLEGARWKLRFAEKRIAALEAHLLEPEQSVLVTAPNPVACSELLQPGG